jgi:hypothetical protein
MIFFIVLWRRLCGAWACLVRVTVERAAYLVFDVVASRVIDARKGEIGLLECSTHDSLVLDNLFVCALAMSRNGVAW